MEYDALTVIIIAAAAVRLSSRSLFGIKYPVTSLVGHWFHLVRVRSHPSLLRTAASSPYFSSIHHAVLSYGPSISLKHGWSSCLMSRLKLPFCDEQHAV